MPSPCSATFRTAALRGLGGIPEVFRGHYEDQVLFWKLLLSCAAMVIDQPLARYRQHASSVTRGNSVLEDMPGSPAMSARRQFLDWLRQYLLELGRELPELDAWIDTELAKLDVPARTGNMEMRYSARRVAMANARRLLPDGVLRRFIGLRQRLYANRVRRRVMRRIRRFERMRTRAGAVADDISIRAYWNARIDDTRLSGHPPGTAGYFAALDAYRLEKSDYLLASVDFDAWAGRDVLEIGCGAGLDLVRFARAGARVTGVDVAQNAIDLAREYCRVAGVEARLIEADGASLPLPAESFDLVYCMASCPSLRIRPRSLPRRIASSARAGRPSSWSTTGVPG